MKIVQVEQNSPEWLEMRKCKITGSKLKDLIVKRGTGKKIGFYQLIADRLAVEDGSVDGRDRGHNLENEAIEEFEKLTGKTVNKDCGMWLSDIDENIAVSPDGGIAVEVDVDDKMTVIYPEAVEVKCLGSARHIEAILTNKIPSEYEDQGLQYFIVNEELETLYFIFYDPRIVAKPLHVIELHRQSWLADIESYRDYQIGVLKEVDEAVAKLAF